MQTQTTWPIAQPATQLLSQTLDSNHIAPAYLFAGSAGVGQVEAIQTWISHLFACFVAPNQKPAIYRRIKERQHPDVLWVEPTYLHQGTFSQPPLPLMLPISVTPHL